MTGVPASLTTRCRGYRFAHASNSAVSVRNDHGARRRPVRGSRGGGPIGVRSDHRWRGCDLAREPERLRPRASRLRAVRVLLLGDGHRLPPHRAADAERQVERHAGHRPPERSAAYTTRRIVVYRPIDAKKFNGTVVVEWLNVSGRSTPIPTGPMTHNELIREGFAWVGVSAQAVGVNQLKCPPTTPPASCAAPGDPVRYGSLVAPRRQLLVRHLLAGRPGDPRQLGDDPRRSHARRSSSRRASRSRPVAW